MSKTRNDKKMHRQLQAEGQAEARSDRSDLEQIMLLKTRPGNSKKEISRLSKKIDKQRGFTAEVD